MRFWINLFIVEVLPIIFLIFGGICDISFDKYPNIKIGYKNKNSISNKLIWEYSNKVASKILGFIGTFLFIINAVILIILGESIIITLLSISIIALILSIIIINKIIVKKINSKNKL